MTNFVVAIAIVLVVGTTAFVMRSRRRADPPTQRTFDLPNQVDRSDFESPTQEWLIVVFTSKTCQVCADVWSKVAALTSPHVATTESEFSTDRTIHDRYGIDAVPAVLVVDRKGVVRKTFLGPVTATDLWAGVAAARSSALDDTVDGDQVTP